MTIAALLEHHGVAVPRYVTVDGQIVFDSVTPTATGFTHTELGSVTAIAPHQFHGGDEPEDNSDSQAWWNDPTKLLRHKSAMDNAFPGFVLFEADDDKSPCWVGTIDTGRGRFRIAIVPRRDGGLPRIVPLGGRFGVNAGHRWMSSPHLYTNGNLCIADEGDWDPAVHTVATAAGWAAHWLAAYTEWRFTRRWPTEGYAPGAAA